MRALAALLLGLVTAACRPAQRTNEAAGAPEAVADGWPTSSLEAEGLNAATMAEVTEFIRRDPYGDFRSLVIARNGRLVFEGYFNGHDRNSLHDIRSATKSITSAAVGIAIADGLLTGGDAMTFRSLAAYAPFAHDDVRKRAITIEHLLTMASGLDADEDEPASPGYEDRLWESADWVRFALDLPMVRAPGQRWTYASVNTFILGLLVEEAAGKPLSAYAQERLFAPLGITEFRWASTPLGRTVAQGNLSLRARDMAKLGQLYLNEGRWAGEQIVPETWRSRARPTTPATVNGAPWMCCGGCWQPWPHNAEMERPSRGTTTPWSRPPLHCVPRLAAHFQAVSSRE